MQNQYDVIILGGGPAGLTAALYTARANLRTLIVERLAAGGQAATTHLIENYPGFPNGINGFELSFSMLEQAQRFGAELRLTEATGVELTGKEKKVITTEGTLTAPAVVLATGAKPRLLGVPGEDRLRGRGVSYCAVCDGAFFRDKEVAVVGGGDSAVEEAVYLTRYASKVYLLVRRDALRATPVVQEKLRGQDKIEIMWNTVIQTIEGENSVEKLTIENRVSGEVSVLPVGGVFVYIGLDPNSDSFGNQVKTDSAGYVLTDSSLMTSIPGVFAAGDLRATQLRQVATAVGDGALAGVAVERYLDNMKS